MYYSYLYCDVCTCAMCSWNRLTYCFLLPADDEIKLLTWTEMTAITCSSGILLSCNPNDALIFSVRYVFWIWCLALSLMKPLESFWCSVQYISVKIDNTSHVLLDMTYRWIDQNTTAYTILYFGLPDVIKPFIVNTSRVYANIKWQLVFVSIWCESDQYHVSFSFDTLIRTPSAISGLHAGVILFSWLGILSEMFASR